MRFDPFDCLDFVHAGQDNDTTSLTAKNAKNAKKN